MFPTLYARERQWGSGHRRPDRTPSRWERPQATPLGEAQRPRQASPDLAGRNWREALWFPWRSPLS